MGAGGGSRQLSLYRRKCPFCGQELILTGDDLAQLEDSYEFAVANCPEGDNAPTDFGPDAPDAHVTAR